MMKKFLSVLFLVFFATNAWAKSGVNIFAYPRKVPESSIYNQYGKSFKLEDFQGNFLLVIFWSKTCIPCLREMEDLSKFAKKVAGNNIQVLLVSPAEDWETAEEQRAFLRRYKGEDLDFYVDRKNALAADFGIFTSPHTVLVNADSMEIGRIRGSVDWDDEDVIEYIYKIKAQHQGTGNEE